MKGSKTQECLICSLVLTGVRQENWCLVVLALVTVQFRISLTEEMTFSCLKHRPNCEKIYHCSVFCSWGVVNI